MIIEGDLGYSDFYSSPSSAYLSLWSQPSFQSLLRNVGVYTAMDDHEFQNACEGATESEDYAECVDLWKSFIGATNPFPSHRSHLHNSYQFYVGDVGFFVVDTVSFRTPNGLLGHQQQTELITWLSDDPSRVKFVITSIPFSMDSESITVLGLPHEFEKYKPYWKLDGSYDLILNFLKTTNSSKVFFLSGDVHASSVFKILNGRAYEVVSAPLHFFTEGFYGGREIDKNERELMFYDSGYQHVTVAEVDTKNSNTVTFHVWRYSLFSSHKQIIYSFSVPIG